MMRMMVTATMMVILMMVMMMIVMMMMMMMMILMMMMMLMIVILMIFSHWAFFLKSSPWSQKGLREKRLDGRKSHKGTRWYARRSTSTQGNGANERWYTIQHRLQGNNTRSTLYS